MEQLIDMVLCSEIMGKCCHLFMSTATLTPNLSMQVNYHIPIWHI